MAVLGSDNITHSGNFKINVNSADRVTIDSSGRLLVGTTTNFDSSTTLQIKSNQSVSPGSLDIQASFTSITTDQNLARIRFFDYGHRASITCQSDGASSSSSDVPGRLVFSTTSDGSASPTEACRITSDKYLRMAAGTGGIQFDGDTAAANALNDYEEGSMAVVWYNSPANTIGWNENRYVKVGNVVTVTCCFLNNTIGNFTFTANTWFNFPTLPFAIFGQNSAASAAVITHGTSKDFATKITEARVALVDISGNRIAFNANFTVSSFANFQATRTTLVLTYRVA